MKENASAVIVIDEDGISLEVEELGEITFHRGEEFTLEEILRLVSIVQNRLGIPYRDQKRELRRLHDLDQAEAWDRERRRRGS